MKKLNIFLILFSICIFIVSLCFIIFSKNQSKEVVNILNWSSYIPDNVIRDFEKETGIKVNYSTYSSNEELLAKVSNVKEGTYDLIFPSDYMVEIMINKNLLNKLDKTKLKNIDNVDNNYLGLYYDKDNLYSLPFLSASTLLCYNKKYIKEDINSFNDLLNSKYKNSIVLIDDQRIIIGMALQALGYDVNTTNQKELDEAYNWLKELKPNIKAYDSDSPKNFLITKEAYIGYVWNAEAAMASMEDENIKIVYPKEGGTVSIDNYAIMKGASNLDNAYRFIDYLLRGEIMKKIIESYPYKSVNKQTDMLLPLEFKRNKAISVSDEFINKSSFIKNVGKGIKLFDNVWIQIK